MKDPEEYLLSLIDYEKTGGMVRSLKTFKEALKKLGNPEREVKNPIIVAGTKGKGSVAHHIAKGLMNAGFKVGLFTSPHLISFRERIKINDIPISKARFGKILEEVSQKLPGRGIRTVFQALTATAFIYFATDEVDFGVFEVGLGGRLDSTNVLRQIRTAFARIDYDHTKILGRSLGAIAKEKAGVIKNRSPVFSVKQRRAVRRVLIGVTKGFDIPFFELERDIPVSIKTLSLEGNRFELVFGGRKTEIWTPAPGIFQVENAALASSILLSLGVESIDFSELRVPGRFEILKEDPLVVLDGAHNMVSLKALLLSVEELISPKGYVVVLAMNRDKPIRRFLKALQEKVKHLIVTEVPIRRAMPAELIGSMAVSLGYRNVSVHKDPYDALNEAMAYTGSNDVVIVTGSFYLVGEIKRAMNPIPLDF